VLLATGTAEAGMYRWVDGNGRVHYSDTPPMTFQQSGGAEMSKQGNIIKRTQSEAERKAEAERLAEEKRIQAEQQKQAQLDRALTQTYTTEAEIDLARDRALENYKLMIRGAEIRASAVEANLTDLRSRIANIQKAGRKVGPSLQEQLDQAVREREELKRTIQNNQAAMNQVREKYAADKARFRELTATK
jgi:small-conductance mechanosensitive channel